MKAQVIYQVFEAVQLVLIIVYCSLSQSICSAFALLTILVDITFMLNKFYREKDNKTHLFESLSHDRKHKVFKPVQIRRYIWMTFLVVNIGFTILKTIYLIADKPIMSQDLKVAFQVNNYVIAYVPVLLIVFGIPLVMIKDQNKSVIKFLKPTSKAFALPVYLILVILLVLIQIFNTSILGLMLVFALIILVGRKKWGFVDGRLYISLIQGAIGIYIVLAFICSMDLIPYFSNIQFWGLQCLKPSQFVLGSNKAYIICLILAFLVTNFINSMFGYQKMHALIQRYEISLSNSVLIQQIQSDLPDNAGTRQKYEAMQNTNQNQRKRKRKQFINEIQMQRFSSENVFRNSSQQNQSQITSQKIEQKDKQQQKPEIKSEVASSSLSQKDKRSNKMSRIAFKQERINSRSKMRLRTYDSKSLKKQFQTDQKLKQIQQDQENNGCMTATSNILANIFEFLTSPILNFRLTQLMSVIIIQRYNTIYSLILIVWLVVSALVTRAYFIRYSMIFLVFPLALANYITSFLYNIPDNPIQNIQCGAMPCSIYGFQQFNNFYWDVVVFDIYIFFILSFIKYSDELGLKNMVYQDKLKQEEYRKKQNSEVSFWLIIVAIIFKYTHLITLILLYWVGFDAANLIHLVLIIIFLIFYAFGSTLLFKFRQKQNGQVTQVITTFTESYWFLIVIFIGICILLKYIYFLFFSSYQADWLDPVGIAEVYNVPFDFSFRVAKSNTTPLFWILILSSLQLAITQSTIYLQYSYSIIAVISAKPLFVKHSKTFHQMIAFLTAMFYKSLFAVSALITLLCDYRWSINGILIGCLASFGLLYGFGEGRLWIVIMWINIVHIFMNYFGMFLDYPAVVQLFGAETAASILKYAYLLGCFQVTSQQLHGLFLTSIIIFILSVQSTQLYHYLHDTEGIDVQNMQMDIVNDIDIQVQTIIENAQKIQLNEQLDDKQIQSANNKIKAQIKSIKELYNMNIFKKYSFLRKLWQILQFFYMDISLLFVILCALFFRLSVSMLVFLVIYLTYYFIVFHEIHNVYNGHRFYEHLSEHMDRLDDKIKQLYDQKNQNIYQDHDNFQVFQQTFNQATESVDMIKMKYKKFLWFASSLITIICLILTYVSQFFISYYWQTYHQTDSQAVTTLRKVMFVLGVSTSEDYSLWRSIYFYFFMVIFNMIQRVMNSFKQRQKRWKQQRRIRRDILSKQRKNAGHQIEAALQKQYLQQQMMQQQVPQDDIVTQSYIPLQKKQNTTQLRKNRLSHQVPEVLKNVNLICFFQINGANMKIKMLFGILSATLRLYILLLLLNSYAKSNIFSWVYLLVALFYWNIRIKYEMVQDINKIAIVILVIQYILLLFNINPYDANYYYPQFEPYTLAGKVIDNPIWLSYLAFGGNAGSQQFRTSTSFIINSLIIFATQYYFRLFSAVCSYTIANFIKIKNFYQYVLQMMTDIKIGQTMFINVVSFKSRSYIILCKLYQLCTVNSFLLLSTMILLIIDNFNSTISIILLVLSSVYFYLALFGRTAEDQKIVDKYTFAYFMLYKVVTFIQFIIVTVFNLPPIIQQCKNVNSGFLKLMCIELDVINIFGELVLLFFVQLWLDLQNSKQFDRFSSIYYKTSVYKQIIMAKCYTYSKNDKHFAQLFNNYQTVLNFENKIQNALKSLQDWYIIMKKQQEFRQLKKQQFSFFLNKKGLITEQWLLQNDKDMTFLDILKSQINHTLYTSNADLVIEIRTHNSRILQDLEVSFSEYVLDKLDNAIDKTKQLDEFNQSLYEDIINSGEFKKEIRQVIDSLGEVEKQPSQVIIPQMLNLNIRKSSLSPLQIILFFLLSKFQYILTLSILIYYLVNPALLSLPIVLFMFSYQIISEFKVKNFVLLYILVLVLFLQIADEIIIISQNNRIPDWFSYLFADAQHSQSLSTGYLNFLFIMILFNQIIKKTMGFQNQHPSNLQNEYQALLRLILDYQNSNKGSLFNILEEDHKQSLADVQEAGIEKMQNQLNPYIIYSQTLQKDSYLIFDNRIPSFFKSFYINKPGADLYVYIASVQIFSTFYLIFFYPAMFNSSSIDMNQTLVYYTFSADMIVVILIYVATLIIQRKITLLQYKRGTKQLIKYIETMIILVLVCFLVFYYAPSGGGTANDSNFMSPPALQIFMFIQMIYFSLSCLQISYGYQKYKRINSLLHKRNFVNEMVMLVFTSVPFLQEIKILMDWAFAKTSLTLNGWSKHFNIFVMSFMAERTAVGIRQYKLGTKINVLTKILLGWCGFFLILLLIFGPMIIFSGLNPASEPNLVTGGSLEIGLSIVGGNHFQFYSTSHFSSPPSTVSQAQYRNMSFNKVPALQGLKPSQLDQQFQSVNYFPYSDNFWQISSPNFQYLNQTINEALQSMKQGKKPQSQFSMYANYELDRNISDIVTTPSSFNYPYLNDTTVLNQSLLQSLNNTLNLCNTPTYLPNFYISLIRLDTSGTTYKARPIFYYGSSQTPNDIPYYTQTVALSLICNDSPDGTTANANGLFWSASLQTKSSQESGIILYVLCDKYQKLSFGLSFIGLYTSVIFVISSFIRKFFTGDISLIPYNMNPRPQYILNICEAIYIMRMRDNLRAEYLLYYELIDIMRSPQIIKFMCGSFTNDIRYEDKIRLRKEQELKMIKQD